MNRALRITANVVWALCVAAVVAYYCHAAVSSDNPGILWFAVFFVVSFVTASPVHELGHFFFGLLSGMRAKLTARSFLPTFGANEVQIVPRRTDKIRSRLTVTALGGLAFNLIFVILGVCALFVPQLPIWLSGISVWHLSLFLDNAFPIEHRTGRSDGLVISELIKNTPEAQVMSAVLAAQAHVLSGKPIEALDRSLLFGLPQIREDDPAFISLCELRAMYLKAAGEEEEAKKEQARFEELKEQYL